MDCREGSFLTFISFDFPTVGLFGDMADRSAFGLGTMSTVAAVYFPGFVRRPTAIISPHIETVFFSTATW